MVKKYTVSLPETLVEQAKLYANKRGASFSGLVRISLEKIIEAEKYDNI